MEERYSLVDHPASFKTKGLKDYPESSRRFIDNSIPRNGAEMEALNQIVSKYAGRKVRLVMAGEGSTNSIEVVIIDWQAEKGNTRPVYQRFAKSPFPSDYIPFAYHQKDDGRESLYLCEKLDTPSPWIRVYNDESSDGWAGHYFGNSIRNCGIIPYTMPEHYTSRLATDVVKELEALASDADGSKLIAAGFENLDHLHYALESARGNIAEGMAEAQAMLDVLNEKMNAQMNQNVEAAKAGGLLDPIRGVSMEDWEAANAKIAGGTSLDEVLRILEIEKPIWDDVSAQWMARMSQDTTFAISKVYGEAFTNPNMGRFASSASGSSAGSSAAVEKVKGDFELYIKIMCHQNMGSTQGIDASSILKQYGLSVLDWSTASAHWSPQMASNLELAMKMSDLMNRFNAEFAAAAPATAASDIEF
jgi:hypothetical protein